MDRWSQWVYLDAPKFGIDPRAADAISRAVEWPSRRGVGDQGTSFGPFQLHVGGALPRGRGRAWAESRAGVDYALAQMARSGARGLRGPKAVAAISRNFERPANPAREIRLASNFYRGHPGMVRQNRAASPLGRMQAPARLQRGHPQRDALLKYAEASLANFASGAEYDPSLIMGLLNTGNPTQPRTVSFGRSTGRPRAARPGRIGPVIFSPYADRPGAKTSGAVRRFVGRLAGIAGHPIHIGTGTNHSRMTVNGNVSDHWSGHAADIPASGKALIKLGQQALIAAGMSPAQARKQKGGLYNVNGHQIIFNTHIGGDHTNHLHVSAY